MKRHFRATLTSVAVALTFMSSGATAAYATYPGVNGRITFGRFDRSIGDYHIWAGNIDGTHQVQLTTAPSEKSDWSPDGSRVAYDFVDSNGNVQIATVNATDGNDVVQLTTAPGFHGEPNYSPTGTRIAFDSDMGNHPAGEGIYVMNANDGGNVVRVTTNSTGGFDGTPKWSPDGSRIAFVRYVPSQVDPSVLLTALYVINADGSGLAKVSDFALNPQDPDWSPDGKWIAFDAREYTPLGDGSQIWLAHPNGTGLHAISSLARKSNLFGPVFSPNGKLILLYGFVASRSGIWTMGTDGSDLKLLPFTPPPPLAFLDWGTAPAA